MTHSPSGRRGDPGNKPDDRFRHLFFDKRGGRLFGVAPDFANHHHGFRFIVPLKHLQEIDIARPDDRITADSHAGGFPKPKGGQLVDRFIGERSTPGDYPDFSFFMDKARHDADLALISRDDSGTVGADDARLRALQRTFHSHHLVHRNALGDTHHQPDAGVRRFQNGISRKRRRDKNQRGGGVRLLHGVLDRVKDRNAFHVLSGFSGRHAGHDSRAVGLTLRRVK